MLYITNITQQKNYEMYELGYLLTTLTKFKSGSSFAY